MQFFYPLRCQREADQPAGMLGHEIDGLGGGVLSGDDEIALILTIFVIHQDDEFPAFDVADGGLDAVKRRCGTTPAFPPHGRRPRLHAATDAS